MKKKTLNHLQFKKTTISHVSGKLTGGLLIEDGDPTVLNTQNCQSVQICTADCNTREAICRTLICNTVINCAPFTLACRL